MLHLIGDWDGTFCDTKDGIIQVKRDAAGNLKLPGETLDSWVRLAQFSILQQAARLFPNDKVAQKALELEYLRIYRERVKDISPLFPGVVSVFERLKVAQRHVAVCTNKNGDFVKIALEHQGLMSYINPVVGAYDVSEGKPAPEGILLVLSKLGLQKSEAVMLGDAVQDILAAKNAGIGGIGITTGVSSRQELQDAGAIAVIDDISEVLSLLL